MSQNEPVAVEPIETTKKKKSKNNNWERIPKENMEKRREREGKIQGKIHVVSVCFLILSLLAGTAQAVQHKISRCQRRPEELMVRSQMIAPEMLPNGIYVARAANFWLESPSKEILIWARHDTLHRQRRGHIVCADLSAGEALNFSVFGTTLIDKTPQNTKGWVWQFQSLIGPNSLEILDQKTTMIRASEFFSQGRFSPGTKWEKLRSDSFRMKTELRGGNQGIIHLVIDYDLKQAQDFPEEI